MKFPHVAVVAVISASSMVSACSEDDTILSLNVEAGPPAQQGQTITTINRITVDVVPAGEGPFTMEFVPPLRDESIVEPGSEGTGGAPMITVQVLDTPFYKRMTLPDSWDKGLATVSVKAFADGTEITHDEASVRIRPEDAFAVFVDLSGEEPPPAEGGAGGAPGTGGTAADGGTDSGGTDSGGAETGGAETGGAASGGDAQGGSGGA